jgi:hypothetical protein
MGTPAADAVAEFGKYKSPLKVTPSTVRNSTRVDAAIVAVLGIGMLCVVCSAQSVAASEWWCCQIISMS